MHPRDTLASQAWDAFWFIFTMAVIFAFFWLLAPEPAYAAYQVRPAPVDDWGRTAAMMVIVTGGIALFGFAIFALCVWAGRVVSRVCIDPYSEPHGDLPSQPARED